MYIILVLNIKSSEKAEYDIETALNVLVGVLVVGIFLLEIARNRLFEQTLLSSSFCRYRYTSKKPKVNPVLFLREKGRGKNKGCTMVLSLSLQCFCSVMFVHITG